jgi:hypothetical protein
VCRTEQKTELTWTHRPGSLGFPMDAIIKNGPTKASIRPTAEERSSSSRMVAACLVSNRKDYNPYYGHLTRVH